jgi:hypothetical protein
MSKLAVLIRERRSENWRRTDYFIIQDVVVNPEEAMRNAINEFLFTDEGKKEITNSFGDFNWGDAISSVTEKDWDKFGIQMKYDNQKYTISGETIEIIVNQDEVLISRKHLQNL